MGMPEINILFKTLAKTASIRSARGVACIIVKDSKVEGKYIYTREKQITQSYDDDNLSLVKEAFNKYGVTNIKSLIKSHKCGEIKEIMPYLFIIIDEFA